MSAPTTPKPTKQVTRLLDDLRDLSTRHTEADRDADELAGQKWAVATELRKRGVRVAALAGIMGVSEQRVRTMTATDG